MKRAVKQSEKVRITAIKIIVLIAILALLFVLMIFSSNWVKSKYQEQYDLVEYTRQYQTGSENLTNAVRGYAATGDKKYYNAYYAELNQDKNRDIAFDKMKQIGLTQTEQDYINLISTTSNTLVPLEENAIENVLAGDLQAAVDAVYGTEYENSLTVIHETTQKLINEIKNRMKSETEKSNNSMIFVDIICCIAIVVVIFSILNLVSFIKKELLTPLTLAMEQMQEISNGNFSSELKLKEDESEVGMLATAIVETKKILRSIIREIAYVLEQMADQKFDLQIKETYVGELSEIRTSFESILNNLNETFHGIKKTTQRVAEGANQLAIASEELAEGAEQQAGTVNEILTSINQMKQVCMEDAAAAAESAQVAKEAGSSLEQSNIQMKELKEAIYEINQSSEKIGGIINTINSIAKETNLLALNAAIEAARAGESGRGFTVVAEHVKELADASSDAANTTTELIQNSINLIEKGTKIAEETSTQLDQVKEGAKRAVNMMVTISDSSKDKVVKMEEITTGINHIAEIVERNSAASQETAATSENQSNQTKTLYNMVDKFRLRREN